VKSQKSKVSNPLATFERSTFLLALVKALLYEGSKMCILGVSAKPVLHRLLPQMAIANSAPARMN
ncbi:MAG: hypothetical protein ACRDEA_17090, partial [Microcystaceae cyanobacterium]